MGRIHMSKKQFKKCYGEIITTSTGGEGSKNEKTQIAKHNKRWKAYLLKHAHPRKLGRYHREAAERNVPVQEVNILCYSGYQL